MLAAAGYPSHAGDAGPMPQAAQLHGSTGADLSLIAAGFFAEDATTISMLRATLAEVQSRLAAAEAEVLHLRADSAELQRVRPQLALLETSYRENEDARRRAEGGRKSLENELAVMRLALAQMSSKEAAALEVANEASWANRFQRERLDALEVQSQADTQCQTQLVDLEKQLAEARGEAGHWRSVASRRGANCGLIEDRRNVGLTSFMQRSLSRDSIMIAREAFDRWTDSAFRKDQQELWSMHVFYLNKQAEVAKKVQNNLCNRYGAILEGLLRRGDWQHDIAFASVCWNCWAAQVSRMWRSVAASTWKP